MVITPYPIQNLKKTPYKIGRKFGVEILYFSIDRGSGNADFIYMQVTYIKISVCKGPYEPCHKKIYLRGLRPVKTQTGLLS